MIAVFAAVDSGQAVWMVGIIGAAVAGVVPVLVAALRRWPASRQWAVFVGVIAVEVGLIILVEQMTG